MGEGQGQLVSNPETHVHDLPDDILVNIMHRLGSSFLGVLPIRRASHEDLIVVHPLQCALVCKRWLLVADTAVHCLALKHHPKIDKHLGNRFRHLTSLTLTEVWIRPADVPLGLASSTPMLEHLYLQGRFTSSIVAIAEALRMWTNLRGLSLSHRLSSRSSGEVETLLDAVCNLQSLEHLRFCIEVDVSAVCERVDSMAHLLTLYLDCPSVPPVLSGHFSHILRGLVLRDFGGTQLPDSLGLFKRLETFSVIRARDLIELPEFLGCLSHLSKLEVSSCRHLASLPTTLGQLSRLKVLRVEECASINLWPESLGNLQALKTLVISGCEILPQRLDQLTGLEYVKIADLQCPVRLLEDLGSLPGLRKLKLLGYPIFEEFPLGLFVEEGFPGFSNLTSLEVLIFCTSLPALGNLTALKKLVIDSCSNVTETLPDDLRHLPNLEICKISSLPGLYLLLESISNWCLLTNLEVSSCNSLIALPEDLGSLPALKELHIESCDALVSLPQSLRSLNSLQVLRVRWCLLLTKLPAGIEELTSLRLLHLRGSIAKEPLPTSLRLRHGLQLDVS